MRRRSFMLVTIVATVGCGDSDAQPTPPQACASADELASLGGTIVYEGDPPGSAPDSNFDIWIVGEPDWTSRAVRSRPGFDGHPSWSPDGASIVFTAHEGEQHTLVIVDLETGDERDLIAGASEIDYPKWLPEGIVYGRGSEHFLVDPADGSTVPYGVGPRVDGFSLSPDRTEMAVAVQDENDSSRVRLFLAQPNGDVLRQLAGNERNALHPQWEPNGRRVAFSGKTGPSRSDWDVFLVDVDTGDLTSITDNPGADWVGGWSPDGEHLVILSEYDEDWDVFTIRPTGEERVRITCAPGNSRYASWTSRVAP